MYKEIFRWVIAIISQPSKAWVLLAKKGEKQEEFLSRFVYPLIGFVTVAAFLGVLFTRKEFDLELALKSSIRTLVSSFGGFYLGAYLMNEIWQGIFKREKDLKLWLRFVGYSSSLMFACCFPSFSSCGYLSFIHSILFGKALVRIWESRRRSV